MIRELSAVILGIGIDSVDINRFAQWHTYPQHNLTRIFSTQEIDYCLQNPLKSAERFAVRFAAREALFKALAAAGFHVPFLTLCRYSQVAKNGRGCPYFELNWKQLALVCPQLCAQQPHIALSLTHTTSTATAFIVISRTTTQ